MTASPLQSSSFAQWLRFMQTPSNAQQVTDISSNQWNWLESKMNCNKASPRSPRGKHWPSKVNIYCAQGRYFNRPGNVGPRLDLCHSLEPLSSLFRSCVLCYSQPRWTLQNGVSPPRLAFLFFSFFPLAFSDMTRSKKICVRILYYHCLCKVTNVFAQ